MTEYRGRTSVEAVKHLQPHPEEAAHRSRACPTSATPKCRNRQQPISMGGRLEGWPLAWLGLAWLCFACGHPSRRAQSKSAVADFDPSLSAEVGQARLRCALLRTRLTDDIDMTRIMETLY